ncbi:MAG TPA: hypothetical protein VKX16_17610 [Chloroflexota bacterium]|nr:hypothetical protein [Chloroflexota bacterium]
MSNDAGATPILDFGRPENGTQDFDGLKAMSVIAPNTIVTGQDGNDPERAVDMARKLTDVVQELVRQLEEQEARSRQLRDRITELEENARAFEGVRVRMREMMPDSVTREDLLAIQSTLRSLAQDPNHIMVLASVAQQANKLLTVINSYGRLFDSMHTHS